MTCMRKVHLALAIVIFALCAACDRKSDFITETSPFAEVQVTTPADGKTAIARRAERFARQHRMTLYFDPTHFELREFSLAVNRADLNITALNVLKGGHSAVSAYARSTPTGAQRAEVDAFLCEVMLHSCPT